MKKMEEQVSVHRGQLKMTEREICLFLALYYVYSDCQSWCFKPTYIETEVLGPCIDEVGRYPHNMN